MQKFLVSVVIVTVLLWIGLIRVVLYHTPDSQVIILLSLFLLWGVGTFTVSLVAYFWILIRNRPRKSRIKTIVDRPDNIIDERQLYRTTFKRSAVIIGVIVLLISARVIVNLK